MDRNTKIGFAIVGWCIINLGYASVLNKQYLVRASKQHRKLAEAHNALVNDLKFASIVNNMND